MSTSTVRRSLRLSVPADMYAQIEHYAKATGTPVAESARLVLAFGLATVEAITEPKQDS